VQSARQSSRNARRAIRYTLGAPVKFEWNEGQQTLSGEGVTRDMSGNSLFLWSQVTPPLGAEVQCQVFLPTVNSSGPSLRLMIEGRIERLERHPREHHLEGVVVVSKRVVIKVQDANKNDEHDEAVIAEEHPAG
jgi:hypothetical protein